MEKFNKRLFDFQAKPPAFIWENISDSLKERNYHQPINRNGKIAVWIAAAAACIVILIVSVFYKPNGNKSHNTVSAIFKPVQGSHQDSMALNNNLLEKIINTPESQKLIAYNHLTADGHTKKYITISGPEGQPVKISSKAATLIISADGEYPPKPVWNKKIDKWKKIMLNSTLSPTSTSLVDILQSSNNPVE
ncbi:MAG: hypothetical protein JSS98_16270 [Bacteroidetes bacterium]|nr:hypothetical protein [Bacteroidota bacterium]